MKKCCEDYMREQFGDDAEIIAEIYGEYVKLAGEKTAEAEQALAALDWHTLDRAAHTLKGNALSVGDEDLAKTAIELRKAAALESEDNCREMLGYIKELLGTL